MDEAAAIDGSRPLEQVADACGIAWGGTALQMTADMATFKVLLMSGKSFTPAQQAWPAVTLEAYAQLMAKRAQNKTLGKMRSLCWTDHANVTKLQTVEAVEIDVKHLRWVAEIIADGSEIRSLAGRAARLADGTSRKPRDRDELMQQRQKDLQGLAGQVRAFDLKQFLSDYPEPGAAVPWALGDHAWVPSGGVSSVSLEGGVLFAPIAAAAGINLQLKVLYVPDYVSPETRMAASSYAMRELSYLVPRYDLKMALAAGPMEDTEGRATYFDKDVFACKAAHKHPGRLARDLLTGVASLARAVRLHKPALILGEGQGALISIAYSKPQVMEKALYMRNVQLNECHEIASAWGGVKAVIASLPRINKIGLHLPKLREGVPSLFLSTDTFPPLQTYALSKVGPHREETKAFLAAVGLVPYKGIDQVPLVTLMEKRSRVMWEHSGSCSGCGKRVYFTGQCFQCRKTGQEEEREAGGEPDDRGELTDAGGLAPASRSAPVAQVPLELLVPEKGMVGVKRWKHGVVRLQHWEPGRNFPVRYADEEKHKYVMRLVEYGGNRVAQLHSCLPTDPAGYRNPLAWDWGGQPEMAPKETFHPRRWNSGAGVCLGSWSAQEYDHDKALRRAAAAGPQHSDKAHVFLVQEEATAGRSTLLYSGPKEDLYSSLPPVRPSAGKVTFSLYLGTCSSGRRRAVTVYSDTWMALPQATVRYGKSVEAEAAAEGATVGAQEEEDDVDLRLYTDKVSDRDRIAEEGRADAGEIEFQVGDTLRTTWLGDQKADPHLGPMMASGELPPGFRAGNDGVLERHVKIPALHVDTWVPVVPEGIADGVHTWKHWIFRQCHAGITGGHRSADKTLMLVQRQCWWNGMKQDIENWTQKCMTCLRFRKVPRKQESPAFPSKAECWDEVMIDLEGP